MKKTLLIFAALAFALTACDKSTYVDGTYSVVFDQEDSKGWKAFLDFTLMDDVVSDVDFDYTHKDDQRLKSTDTAYASSIRQIKQDDTWPIPSEFLPAMESQLANATIVPEFVEIDGVTGATGSTNAANALFAAGLEAALEGTTTVEVVQYDPPTK